MGNETTIMKGSDRSLFLLDRMAVSHDHQPVRAASATVSSPPDDCEDKPELCLHEAEGRATCSSLHEEPDMHRIRGTGRSARRPRREGGCRCRRGQRRRVSDRRSSNEIRSLATFHERSCGLISIASELNRIGDASLLHCLLPVRDCLLTLSLCDPAMRSDSSPLGLTAVLRTFVRRQREDR
jgi:hypothetical protein